MSECRALVVVTRPVTAYDRMQHVIADPNTMEVVGQRVMEGDTLKKIARSWGVPVMQFIHWITSDPERAAVYEAALRIRADEMIGETLEIADVPTVRIDADGMAWTNEARDKLRIDTRMKLAAYFDRQRFGDTKSRQTAAKVVVDRSCGNDRDSVTVEVGGE